ncbi:Hypothetical predicted protein [Marmota monax]|uniref:Uncharacterized protein n=1 Tax=Marmota monax TaxID=9995 RepID=A0A5E4ATT1_MARMO|nr:hypothetical protein GHT09_018049 [Marmota monax]VTJ60176.1 Hypothetical predicted protein [Marmota monax]
MQKVEDRKSRGQWHILEPTTVCLLSVISRPWHIGMNGHGWQGPMSSLSPQCLPQAGLEQRLAHAKQKASQMEKLLPEQVTSEDQREVLRLLCRAHELEVENTELQANSLYWKNLLCQKDFMIQRYHQHRLLCEQVIQEQRQLMQDSGIQVPESLDKQYRLYSQERSEGTLDRLLLLHSVMSGSLQDGSILHISPMPEEPS